MERLSHRQARQVRTDKVNRRGQRVLVFDRVHPHCGETGYTVPGDVIEPDDGGPSMVRVNLDPGDGSAHCYAEAAQLMPCTHSYSSGASDAR